MWSRQDVKNYLPRHILRLTSSSGCTDQKRDKIEILCEQVLDSLIVGGIGGFTTYLAAGEAASIQGFVIAFGLAFLFKLKEYRKIK
jgi:hypothetical protein